MRSACRIRSDLKRIVHPELGVLELHCQMLFDFEKPVAGVAGLHCNAGQRKLREIAAAGGDRSEQRLKSVRPPS